VVAEQAQMLPVCDRCHGEWSCKNATATANRGYGHATVDKQLTDLAVTNVVIPRTAKPTQQRWAENTEKGSAATPNGAPEATAGSATSNAAMAGTAPASTAPKGTRIWTGHGVGAHNFVKISARPGRLKHPKSHPTRSARYQRPLAISAHTTFQVEVTIPHHMFRRFLRPPGTC
jgi:hypothetical protein